MATASMLNTIGLALGMLGVVVIFIYGPPQPSFEEGIPLGLEDNTPLPTGITVAEHNERVHRLRARHSAFSKGGLVLVFVGFAFQLWAVWA